MKLSLKKTQITEFKKKEPQFHFKTLKITPTGVRCIGLVQNQFEAFWKDIDAIYGSRPEKRIALQKLKDSCSWMCRSIANYNEEENE